MEQLKFEKPNETHENAYYILTRDWKDSQCALPRLLVPYYDSYSEVMLAYNRMSRGNNPSSTYFLMDGERIAGLVLLRHKLDAFMQDFGGHLSFSLAPDYRGKGLEGDIVRLAKEAARKELGLPALLVSFGKANEPMRKAAEANGGKRTSDSEKAGIEYLTYRIRLTA